jgi:hypothetical protein
VPDLHETHRWGERAFQGSRIPFCLDCRTDGFEDEPAAFEECPGKPEKEKRTPCPVTKDSWDNPGHTHRCLGGIHPNGMHFCEECLEWFGVS